MAGQLALNETFDSIHKLTLADLRHYGLILPNHRYSSTIRWIKPQSGVVVAEIYVTVDLATENGLVTLDHNSCGEQVRCSIGLVARPSNLGKGSVWYFTCPQTQRLCRTLYRSGNYFVSRKAIADTLYDSQTTSKRRRALDKIYGPAFETDHALADIWMSHAKRHYRGTPTPKLRRLIKWAAKSAFSKPINISLYTSGRKDRSYR